tara:strand:+ start:839 stop:1192 length:354 start_codon:yes stop_codon:yes gene_type:complete
MSGKRKQKYFPNNWQRYKDAPDSMFMPHTFEEIVEIKLCAWELPSNIACMIRERNIESGKVKEYVYRQRAAAEKKVETLMSKEGIEFTVCTATAIHFVSPDDISDYDDDFDVPDDNE